MYSVCQHEIKKKYFANCSKVSQMEECKLAKIWYKARFKL